MKHLPYSQSQREQLCNRQSHGGNRTSRGIFQEHDCTREQATSPHGVSTQQGPRISLSRGFLIVNDLHFLETDLMIFTVELSAECFMLPDMERNSVFC